MKNKVKRKIIAITIISISNYIFAFLLNSFVIYDYKFQFDIQIFIDGKTFTFFLLFTMVTGLIILLYYYYNYWIFRSRKILEGKERDKHIKANLEEAHFQSNKEIKVNFGTIAYRELPNLEIKGIPIKAIEENRRFDITFSPPTHTLIIGTTGSGKTTSFVNPTIQILANSKTKPSMLISDPKGELYLLHAKELERQGYQVKILDLRNPYNSIRWNPLEKSYLNCQRILNLDKEVIVNNEKGCHEFDGKTYYDLKEKEAAVQVKKQQLSDYIYEDIHDIVTVLCPVTNKNEPIWESGAKNFVLSLALAMLEDCENPELGLTKEKFNFYSLMKLATNTENDCEELIKYFSNRSPLSKAVSLSKQVISAPDKTRGSYLSSVFDKLSIFSDLSLCALTSANEIEFGNMGEEPIALFLQIPDEKETRHTLAAMVILQAYKELVFKANSFKDLTLPKPVYFILDEFGNLPKIHKLEQMITVGRSRNIWLNLVVQSYSQLAKVYDDKSADIIKSNCNTQIFIGTSDYKTIEEFSKKCGNYSVIQRSVGFNSSKADDINSNSSVKERPLIYPSELQELNNSKSMGNAIITIFGYPPIKSKFTPSYKSTYYHFDVANENHLSGRYFDEKVAYYDMYKRNNLIINLNQASKKEMIAFQRRSKMILDKIIETLKKIDYLSIDEIENVFILYNKQNYQKTIELLRMIQERAKEEGRVDIILAIDEAIEKIQIIEKGEMYFEKK